LIKSSETVKLIMLLLVQAEGWALLGSLASGSYGRIQASHEAFRHRADEVFLFCFLDLKPSVE